GLSRSPNGSRGRLFRVRLYRPRPRRILPCCSFHWSLERTIRYLTWICACSPGGILGRFTLILQVAACPGGSLFGNDSGYRLAPFMVRILQDVGLSVRYGTPYRRVWSVRSVSFNLNLRLWPSVR